MEIDIKSQKRQRGIGLAETLVAAGVGALVIGGTVIGLKNSSNSQRKTESSIDRAILAMDLSRGLDCTSTMTGRTMGNPCPTNAWIDLKAANGKVLVKADGTTKRGQWNIRALCSSTGLDIRVAKLTSAGAANSSALEFSASTSSWFVRDEVNTKLEYSWKHPKAQLQPQCQYWFGGTPTTGSCGDNQIVKNVDLAAGTVECANVPNCTGDNALRWDAVSHKLLCDTITGPTNWIIKNIGLKSNGVIVRSESDFKDCAKQSKQMCPDGYVMDAYEHKQEDGQTCRVFCVKLLP